MFKAVLKITGSPEKMVREFGRILKEQLQEMVDFWHANRAKKHFTWAGAYEYSYKPRSTKYLRRKKQRHLEPLVWSGESKRQILRMIKISGTRKKASGEVTAPRYFWMTPKGHPNKAEELYTVSQRETDEMALILDEKMCQELNKVDDEEVYE